MTEAVHTVDVKSTGLLPAREKQTELWGTREAASRKHSLSLACEYSESVGKCNIMCV